jgi:endonuclease YncB( thermonuclease family)
MLLGLLLLPGLAWAQLEPYGVVNGTVSQVVDGDTLRLDNGMTVRLLDINTPELAHGDRPAEPMALAAKQALATLALHQPVQVQLGRRVYDTYNRVLGHVYLRNGSRVAWVNGGLVQGGYAHVYTFPDNRQYGPELQQLEATARAKAWGLWALPRWQIRPAAQCCAEVDFGRFVLVQGVVKAVATVDDRTYLNFGEDWRTDFSVVIDRKHEKNFRPAAEPKEKAAKKPKKRGKKAKKTPFNWYQYLGQTVLVRGVAQPVNGTQIRVTHPEQLQVVAP